MTGDVTEYYELFFIFQTPTTTISTSYQPEILELPVRKEKSTKLISSVTVQATESATKTATTEGTGSSQQSTSSAVTPTSTQTADKSEKDISSVSTQSTSGTAATSSQAKEATDSQTSSASTESVATLESESDKTGSGSVADQTGTNAQPEPSEHTTTSQLRILAHQQSWLAHFWCLLLSKYKIQIVP